MNSNGTIEAIDNHDHIFEIGSITKVMTSTILANLVHEGKISLDDPLQDHVPYKLKRPKIDGVTVTVQIALKSFFRFDERVERNAFGLII